MRTLLLLFISLFFVVSTNAEEDEKLILYWSFDDADAFDYSENGYNGEIGGNVFDDEDSPFEGGLSMRFTGDVADSITNVDVIEELNELTAFTVSLWVKSDVIDTDNGFLICSTPWNPDRDLLLRYDKAGWVSGGTNVIKAGLTVSEPGDDADTVEVNIETYSDLQVTEWQHVLFCWEQGDTNLTLYVDGIDTLNHPAGYATSSLKTDTKGVSVPVDGAFITGMTKVYLGKGSKNKESSWQGLIDEFVILNYKVSADEVKALHEGTVPHLPEETNTFNISGTLRSDFKVMPNPFDGEAVFEFTTNKESEVTIKLFDVNGRKIETIANRTYGEGSHTINWSNTDLGSGIYFATIMINNHIKTIKVINE